MLRIEMEAEGLEEMQVRMKALKKLGSVFKGVNLNPVQRVHNADASNDEILEHLKRTGRDFVTLDSADAEKVAQAYIDEFERLWDVDKGKDPQKRANNIDARGLKNAMKEYMRIVSNNIDNQKTHDGYLEPLSEEYAKWKQKKFGFTDPIGKAYGELLKNLNPTGPSAGRIRPTRY